MWRFGLLAPAFAAVKEIAAGTAESKWADTASTLQAGDTLRFRAGTYSYSSYHSFTWAGTPANPIVVEGAAGEKVILSMAGEQNLLNLNGHDFVIRNLELTNPGHTGARGIVLAGGTAVISNVLIEGNNIHDVSTAITCNGGVNCQNITIRNNEIHDTCETGECVYLGNSEGTTTLTNSLIEFNYCHDISLETCGGGSGGSRAGFQIKTGSSNNTVRDNVCRNTPGPCVLVYDDYDRGANLVERNVAVNSEDNCYQATAGAIIRNNLAIGCGGAGVANIANGLQSGKNLRNIKIIHNTVYNPDSEGIRGGGWSGGSATILVQNNAIVASNSWAGTYGGGTFQNNGFRGGSLPGGVAASGGFALGTPDTEFVNAAANNLSPKLGGKIQTTAGDTTNRLPSDFDCRPRTQTASVTVGAYTYDSATAIGATTFAGYKLTCIGGGPTGGTNAPTGAPTETPEESEESAASTLLPLVAPLLLFLTRV